MEPRKGRNPGSFVYIIGTPEGWHKGLRYILIRNFYVLSNNKTSVNIEALHYVTPPGFHIFFHLSPGFRRFTAAPRAILWRPSGAFGYTYAVTSYALQLPQFFLWY